MIYSQCQNQKKKYIKKKTITTLPYKTNTINNNNKSYKSMYVHVYPIYHICMNCTLKPINDINRKRTRKYRNWIESLKTFRKPKKKTKKNTIENDWLIETKVPRWGAREFAKHHVANGNHISVCRLWRHCPEHILWTRYNAHLWHGGKYSTRKIKQKYQNTKTKTKLNK